MLDFGGLHNNKWIGENMIIGMWSVDSSFYIYNIKYTYICIIYINMKNVYIYIYIYMQIFLWAVNTLIPDDYWQVIDI